MSSRLRPLHGETFNFAGSVANHLKQFDPEVPNSDFSPPEYKLRHAPKGTENIVLEIDPESGVGGASSRGTPNKSSDSPSSCSCAITLINTDPPKRREPAPSTMPSLQFTLSPNHSAPPFRLWSKAVRQPRYFSVRKFQPDAIHRIQMH